MGLVISRDYEAYSRRETRHVEPRAALVMAAHRTAIDELATLVRISGALKMITALRDPVTNMPITHDITRITGPTAAGEFVAYTREGDNIRGRAPALLARLTEANRIGVVYRKAVHDGLLKDKVPEQGPNDGIIRAATMSASGKS